MNVQWKDNCRNDGSEFNSDRKESRRKCFGADGYAAGGGYTPRFRTPGHHSAEVTQV